MKDLLDFVKTWFGLDSVKVSLGVLVGYLFSLATILPADVRAALVALVLAAIGLYAGWKANKIQKARWYLEPHGKNE